MVQVIQNFLVSIIGDVAFNTEPGTITLMQLCSYVITLGIFSFILTPIISIFRIKNK